MAFLMLENPLVALVAKSYLLIVFNCKTSKTSKTSFDLIFFIWLRSLAKIVCPCREIIYHGTQE